MEKKIAFCALLFVIVISSCLKSNSFSGASDELTGSPNDLIGEWKVSSLVGNDVASYKMVLNFNENKTLLAFDGCNHGSAAYTAAIGNTIQMAYPSFTYMYCNKYHGSFGYAIQDSKKYSVASKTLKFYNEKGQMILSAVKN